MLTCDDIADGIGNTAEPVADRIVGEVRQLDDEHLSELAEPECNVAPPGQCAWRDWNGIEGVHGQLSLRCN